jgi:hypothetical protein
VRHNKIGCFIGLSIILALLAVLFPVHAQAVTRYISLQYPEGKIGDWIGINVYHSDVTKLVDLYFSSDEANIGNDIGDEVTAYQHVGQFLTIPSSIPGFLNFFIVPDRLTDGEREEDAHDGDYYLYAAYHPEMRIVCKATFTVIGSEIEIDPEEGVVGSEVEISGEGMRPHQKISVEYDDNKVDIINGDLETNGDGQFVCLVAVPESASGDHTIAVSDESGDRGEATFSVGPKITLYPAGQAIGGIVQVRGRGFLEDETITLVIDGLELATIPASLDTDDLGSFDGSFVVPFLDSCEAKNVGADDSEGIRLADTQLAVLAGIALSPVSSPSSPGYAGMRLNVSGVGFIAGADVTVIYTVNGEATPVVTAKADDNGRLSVGFNVPPSIAGSHVVMASDGVTTLTSIFTMESQAPLQPRLLMPEISGTSEAEAYFQWEDVTDPSGVSYTLQVATGATFADVVLKKEGLLQPEYSVSEGEKLASTKAGAPYYWRVRAVDGASNEGDWSPAYSFHVGSSWLSNWLLYLAFGFGILFLSLIVIFLRKRSAR